MTDNFVLTVCSEPSDDEPQYKLHFRQPKENGRLMSLFHLVRSVYDDFDFRLVAGRMIFVPSKTDIGDTAWHSDLGRLIESYFQAELLQIMHQDWDSFSLIWNSESYPEWTAQP